MNPSFTDQQGTVFWTRFTNWTDSVTSLLTAAGLAERIPIDRPILIKPNLVETLEPPITTPVEIIAALTDFIRAQVPAASIIVGEGCGSLEYDTRHVFDVMGYTAMARQKNIELLDLNEAPLTEQSRPECERWPTMHLPEIVFNSFLISVPQLKAHSLAGVTLTMKNMMGLAPPSHYQQGGHWKKASFHNRIQEAVLDLNRYRTPDFTLLDATQGMAESHLSGPTCSPPPRRLAAGFDPVAMDSYGCGLLKKDWRKIGHIRRAHQELGLAEPLNLVETSRT